MSNNLITKKQAQGIIEVNNIKTSEDIMSALKGMFKDVIQEMLEKEMNNSLNMNVTIMTMLNLTIEMDILTRK